MPGKMMKIGSFSDWEGLFKEWRAEIGVNHDDIRNFKFDTLYGAIETEEISFGYYKGRNKWENVRQIPTQNMRDALMNLIVYQGDTEFASVEQQRWLFETAPSDYDRSSLTRVMIEEMRHGWQMCALLIDHFSSAHWAYTWGLKGRYDELKNETAPDLDNLNDYNRHLYRDECVGLVKRISAGQRPGSTELYCPDIKFNRMIGRWKGQMFHPQTGQPLEEKEYKQQIETWLPTPADKKLLLDIIGSEKKWIAPKTGAKDPLLTIAEVRKSALNPVQ